MTRETALSKRRVPFLLLVQAKRLELSRRKPPEPKSGVSTHSTTPAKERNAPPAFHCCDICQPKRENWPNFKEAAAPDFVPPDHDQRWRPSMYIGQTVSLLSSWSTHHWTVSLHVPGSASGAEPLAAMAKASLRKRRPW